MSRKTRTPEEQARREKIRALLQESNVTSMEDIQNLFKETIAEFMENGLESELDESLGYGKYDYKNKDTDNSRNGHSRKNLRTSFGNVEISVPRDRKGEFEPQLVKKNQTSVSQDIEEKIFSMYAKGMSTSDIESHIQDIEGRKDVLGIWVGENESAKFWAGILNSMRNRGVEDTLIACTDNLTGFSAAIEAVFPKTEIQNCIIHQLRNSSKYVSYKDLKELMADLKEVYAVPEEGSATAALERFSDRWDKKYPKISQSWRDNWANLITYFKYPTELRRLIYTTNTIEGFNRQLRKVTKARSVFPTDDSLLKMLYLAMMDITKKWTGRRQDWSIIHAQMAIYFEDRLPE